MNERSYLHSLMLSRRRNHCVLVYKLKHYFSQIKKECSRNSRYAPSYKPIPPSSKEGLCCREYVAEKGERGNNNKKPYRHITYRKDKPEEAVKNTGKNIKDSKNNRHCYRGYYRSRKARPRRIGQVGGHYVIKPAHTHHKNRLLR